MTSNKPDQIEAEGGASSVQAPSVMKDIYFGWAISSYVVGWAKKNEKRRIKDDEEGRAWRECGWAITNDEVKNDPDDARNPDILENEDGSDDQDAMGLKTLTGAMIWDAVEQAMDGDSGFLDIRLEGKWNRIPYFIDSKDEDKHFHSVRADRVRGGGVLAEVVAREADLRGLQECSPLPSRSKPIHISDFITSTHSCELCGQLPIVNSPALVLERRCKLCDNFSELCDRAKLCNFYKAVLSSVAPHCSAKVHEINIFTKSLSLSVEGEAAEYSIPRMRRVFAAVGSSAALQEEIPIIPERGSEADMSLCRTWLQICDGHHKHADSYIGRLPTRVIDVGVGDEDDMDCIHLRVTNGEAWGMYIALSHRWQNDTPVSTAANLDDQRGGINLSNLPQTYQDAVQITRKLGARFLWIDSLCIIQDGSLDWASECGRMEEVFASAYCTIAISPAIDAAGNFEDDVENGELSSRGWILQERALSRRTIHFTGEQIYWECGSAIWSKTAGKGVRPLSALGSSQFPQLELPQAPQDKWAVFKDMFTRYSKLGLTVKSDRPVAMGGLEFRMATSYQTQSVFGIVKGFFGESLLWQRSGNKWMEPIFDFVRKETSKSGTMVKPPSWSWMAYTGGIRYGNLRDDRLTWMKNIDFEYTDHRCILTAPLERISLNCHVTFCGDTDCDIRDDKDAIIGWIRFDCAEEGNLDCRGCIKVSEGTTSWREYACVSWDIELPGSCSYILMLRELEVGVYRRVGVGFILSQWLSSSENRVQIF